MRFVLQIERSGGLLSDVLHKVKRIAGLHQWPLHQPILHQWPLCQPAAIQ